MSALFDSPPQPTGYLLLFRGTDISQQRLSEAELRESMEKVKAWFAELSAAGKLLGAQPLFEESVVISGKGARSVVDGPFVEAKEAIGGYVLLAASSMDEAVAIAKANPMNEHGLVTEVRTTASSCPHFHRTMTQLQETAAAAA